VGCGGGLLRAGQAVRERCCWSGGRLTGGLVPSAAGAGGRKLAFSATGKPARARWAALWLVEATARAGEAGRGGPLTGPGSAAAAACGLASGGWISASPGER